MACFWVTEVSSKSGASWVGRVLVVEFSANLVGLNWLRITLNLALNLSPRGFLGRPRLGGGI